MEASVESMRREKRSKKEQKLLRRGRKTQHTLLRHAGISTSQQPTQYLVVSNGGLGNGVSREALLEVLKEGGAVESLLMPPNKPYSYVTYASVEDGQNAHRLLSGRVLKGQDQDVTLYFSYVHQVGSEGSVLPPLPPGLSVVEEFVSVEEEAELLQAVDWTSHPEELTVQRELKHRRVKHYGYEFRYDNNNVDKDKPLPGGLPPECGAVLQKCLSEGHISVLPDQLTVNQYLSGQGIPPHVDTHSPFEDTILSLSLGAKTVMDFRHPDGRSVAVVLPGRSLLVMKGESRYLWTHGITPRKFDVVPASEDESSGVVTSDPGNLTLSRRGTRTSFTFRKIRHSPCDCAYPSVCDSQRPPSPPALPVANSDAFHLEAQYVHQVYEEISAHFSSTRHAPWPRVREFLLSLQPGDTLADIGCGNGKYLGINPQVMSVGCDRSVNLVGICADRGFQAFVSDALNVPLRSSSFDACISIAVIHHFSTQERRLAAIGELVRLLKVGGRALIYVWAKEQEYNKQKSKYLKTNKNQENLDEDCRSEESKTEQNAGQEHPEHQAENITSGLEEQHDGKTSQTRLSIHTNRTAFASQDLLVPWHLKGGVEAEAKSSQGRVFHRYYHVFQQGELEELCRLVKGVTVLDSYHDQGNWCVVLEKTLGDF
ncbi:LOW QUALITY PROTEIN: tRNA (carboxymethyluridine(34)-5-O)-methyltransferase ALKBH8 [Salminus brasiliensis]|uniref:LOW QUALITY PROTEIN: tRNA (carboxymethyluridine(34)-5-O)-methyltransferase ALKBH8 n=1 Tax=Salminus brasiliensis TaxID=930266 RepID=UPI003B836C30